MNNVPHAKILVSRMVSADNAPRARAVGVFRCHWPVCDGVALAIE